MGAAFAKEPTTIAELRGLADECVMCGLCLPHCPTFRLSGLESQSPRGRIALAKGMTGDDQVDASVRAALESCLQCRACEAACPAHVRYGEIIDGARALLARSSPPTLPQRLAAHPRATAFALSLGGRVARLWPALTRQLGRRARWLLQARTAVRLSPASPAPLALFVGCLARSFDSESQHAVLRVAKRIGADLAPLAGQSCCGTMARHLGDAETADHLAKRNRAAWTRAGTRTLVALDSGCIDGLRRAAADFAAIEVIEACRWLLDQQSRWRPGLRIAPMRIGVFAPCSHRHVVGDAEAAGRLLALLPGVQWVQLSTGLGCCGAAGPQLLAHPDQADALALPIIDAITDLQLDAIATTNVGCALHLAERLELRGVKLPVRHPVAFLADRLPN